MSGFIVYSSNVWIYLVLTLLTLFINFRYNEEFKPTDLINSFIYLTNKVNITVLFFTFLFMFIFSIVDFTDPKIITFFEDTIKGILYYSFFSYFVFYGIKLIYYMKKFIRDNDLFVWAFFDNTSWGKKEK